MKYISGTGCTTIISHEAQEPMNSKNFAGLIGKQEVGVLKLGSGGVCKFGMFRRKPI